MRYERKDILRTRIVTLLVSMTIAIMALDLKTLSMLSESLVNNIVKIAYKKAIPKAMALKKQNRNDSIHGLVLHNFKSDLTIYDSINLSQ